MTRSPVAVLDLRHLSPPEPMERILTALESLPPGEGLVAITPLYPAPLLAILAADGFAYRLQSVDGGHRLLIVRLESAELLAEAWDGGDA